MSSLPLWLALAPIALADAPAPDAPAPLAAPTDVAAPAIADAEPRTADPIAETHKRPIPEATGKPKRPGARPGGPSLPPDPDGPRGAMASEEVSDRPYLRPNLQLQMWGTIWDQDEEPQADPAGYGDPEADPGFSIYRARVGVGGSWKQLSYMLRVGAGQAYDALSPRPPAISLVDAYVGGRFQSPAGNTQVVLGTFNVPFSRESQMSSNDLPFQERAVNTNWMAAGRDVGVTLNHRFKWAQISAGAYNGNGFATSGVVNANSDVDPGLLYVGRVELEFLGDSYLTAHDGDALGIGASALYNDELSTDRVGVGVDLFLRLRGFSLLVEGQRETITPDEAPDVVAPEVPEHTVRWGGLAQLAWYGKLPVGYLQPAVRFAYFDDNADVADNGQVGILHAGLMWRNPWPGFDLGATFVHRMELGGRDLPNDTVRMIAGFRL